MVLGLFVANNTVEDDFFRRRTLSLSDFDGSRGLGTYLWKTPFLTRSDCASASLTRPQGRGEFPAYHDIQLPSTPGSTRSLQGKPRYYEWDYGSTPRIVKVLDEDSGVMWFGDEESIQNDHSCMLPEQLEAFISEKQVQNPFEQPLTHNVEPPCTIDADLQIKTAGLLVPSLVTSNHSTEGALVPSFRGEIETASTPKLTQDDSDEEIVPVVDPGLDASPSSLHFFSQAGVHITTRDLQNDFVAAQVTSLAGSYLDIDQISQIEKDRVTSEFFGLSKSWAASSSLDAASPTGTVHVQKKKQRDSANADQKYLLPAIYDDLADEDYYLGRDTNAHSDPYFNPKSRTLSEETPRTDNNMLPAPLRYQLHRPSKAQRKDDFNINGFSQRDSTSTIGGISLNQLFIPRYEQPVRHLVTETTNTFVDFTVANPPFRNSALMQRRIEKLDPTKKRKADNHESTSTSNSKRARLTFPSKHVCQINAHASHLSSVQSTPSTEAPSTSSTSNLISHHLTSPMPQALAGFTGQFALHIPTQPSPFRTTQRVFGSPTHPNGLITNTRFIPDSRPTTFDLTENNINHDASHLAITHHAEQQSVHAAGLHVIRTTEENDLRREAHRECTSARLEGIPVGYYRYFLGHMTVEEYIEAGLCVCWEGCFCNKFCTRFGDLKCPCTGNLVLVEEESSG